MWYAVLLAPAAVMLYRLAYGLESVDALVSVSGEWSARFVIVALAVTPLRRLWPGPAWTAWLARRRRALGVSAFAYAAIHTVFYVLDMASLDFMLAELGALGIWTGWLALFILLPLGLTSNDGSVRRLGRWWRPLHRLVYVAALAVLLHWIFVHNNAWAAWLHFVPLLVLEVTRVRTTAFR